MSEITKINEHSFKNKRLSIHFVLSSSVLCILIGQAKCWYHNAYKAVLKFIKMCCLSNKYVSDSVCAHWRPIICFGAAIKDNWWMYISCLEPVWPISTEPSLCPIRLQYKSIVAVCTRDTMILMTNQCWCDHAVSCSAEFRALSKVPATTWRADQIPVLDSVFNFRHSEDVRWP